MIVVTTEQHYTTTGYTEQHYNTLGYSAPAVGTNQGNPMAITRPLYSDNSTYSKLYCSVLQCSAVQCSEFKCRNKHWTALQCSARPHLTVQ